MKLSEHSVKAKEKFADGLMSVSNSIHAATFVGILVLPLTSFITMAISGSVNFSISAILTRMSWYQIWIFGFLYLVPIAVGMYGREVALRLYDEIHDKTS